MRKLTSLLAFAFFMLGSIAPKLALAESIEKANQKDIRMLLAAAGGGNSAYLASLIGETEGRVFIEYVTAIYASSFFSKGPKRVVYWLPRAEITDEQLTQFKTYKDISRIVDALKPGMTQGEAAAAIKSLGFEKRIVANRPAAGWSDSRGLPQMGQVQASEVERRLQKEVLVAETYPIGFRAVNLFYGSDGRLLERSLYRVKGVVGVGLTPAPVPTPEAR